MSNEKDLRIEHLNRLIEFAESERQDSESKCPVSKNMTIGDIHEVGWRLFLRRKIRELEDQIENIQNAHSDSHGQNR